MRTLAYISVVITLLVSNPAFSFNLKHPGLLMTDADIQSIADRSASPETLAAFDNLMRDPRSSADYQQQAQRTILVGKFKSANKLSFKDDAFAAYANAIVWAVTGKQEHLARSIQIMDDWSTQFKSFSVVAGTEKQPYLEASWLLPIWSGAGEIVRYHNKSVASWDAAKVDQFGRFLDNLSRQAEQALSHKSNWGATAAYGLLAASVFKDDVAGYRADVQTVKSMLPIIIKDSGEPRELRVRDCNHPQYSLTALTQSAEVAANQGDLSVWKASNKKGVPYLASGLRYLTAAMLEGDGVRDCRKTKLQPGYGWIAAKAYARLGVDLGQFPDLVRAYDGESTNYQFIGWAGLVGE